MPVALQLLDQILHPRRSHTALSPFLVNKVLSDLAVALQRVQLQAFSRRTQSWLSLLPFFKLPSNLSFLGNLSALL